MKCMARLVMRGASTDAASCVLCKVKRYVILPYNQARGATPLASVLPSATAVNMEIYQDIALIL